MMSRTKNWRNWQPGDRVRWFAIDMPGISSDVFEGIVSDANENRALIIVQDKSSYMRLWCDDDTVDEFEKIEY